MPHCVLYTLKEFRGSPLSLCTDQDSAGLGNQCLLALIPGLTGGQSIVVLSCCSLHCRVREAKCTESCVS